MPLTVLRAPLLVALVTLPGLAAAQGFATSNESALARGVVLPVPHATGRTGWSAQMDLTNDFVLKPGQNDSLRLDGESLRLRINGGLTAGRWTVGATLPLIQQGGGFMDQLIQDWHDFFGLPNAGRERRPDDEFVYRAVDDGVTRLDVTDGRDGLGDIQLWAATPLGAAQLHVMLQLPTGDEDALLGAGRPGAAVWLERPWHQEAWFGHLTGGLSWTGAGGALKELRREFIPVGSAAVGWNWTQWLALIGQVNAHAPLFDGIGVDVLDKPGVQLVLGGRLTIGAHAIDIGFQEDIVTASSPDFSLHFAWRPSGR